MLILVGKPRRMNLIAASAIAVGVVFVPLLSGCGPMLSAAAPYHPDPRGMAALSALGQGVTALEAAEHSRSSINVYQQPGGGAVQIAGPGTPPNCIQQGNGRFAPAPGFTWMTDAPGDFRVRWVPGARHPQQVNVIAGDRENTWRAAPGYKWVNPTDPSDVRVEAAPEGAPASQLWMTYWNSGNEAYGAGRYSDAERLFGAATREAESTPGAKLVVAMSLHHLGLAQLMLAKYPESAAVHKRALELYESIQGNKGMDIAAVLSNLGIIQQKLKNPVEAKACYERSIAILEELAKSDPSARKPLGNSFANLGVLELEADQYAESRAHLERARELLSGQPDTQVEVARTLNNLAIVYTHDSEFAAAEAAIQKAMGMLPESHADRGTFMRTMGSLRLAQHRPDEAKRLYEQAIEALEKSLGKDHPETQGARAELEGMGKDDK
jgi:tetratricopeptide (TPR) repeat protein